MYNVKEGKLQAAGMKFGIVVPRFNEFICSKLLGGAYDALLRHGIGCPRISRQKDRAVT